MSVEGKKFGDGQSAYYNDTARGHTPFGRMTLMDIIGQID